MVPPAFSFLTVGQLLLMESQNRPPGSGRAHGELIRRLSRGVSSLVDKPDSIVWSEAAHLECLPFRGDSLVADCGGQRSRKAPEPGFAYTGGSGEYAIYESLHAPSDLDSWLTTAGLLDAHSRPATKPELATAIKFRTTAWDLMTARATGKALDPSAALVVNRLAAGAPLIPQLALDGRQHWHRPAVAAGLAHLARETIKVITDEHSRLRQCAASDCALLYVDTSRSGRRKWCTMQRCGNRHKVKDFRARQVP